MLLCDRLVRVSLVRVSFDDLKNRGIKAKISQAINAKKAIVNGFMSLIAMRLYGWLFGTRESELLSPGQLRIVAYIFSKIIGECHLGTHMHLETVWSQSCDVT